MIVDPIEAPNRDTPDDPHRWALARRMAARMGERYVQLLAPPEATSEWRLVV